MSLRAESVDFAYHPTRVVLHGVTAEFAPGRVTAIIGPNGAGKSTLLRLLAGVARPTRGRVTWGGNDVASMPATERARAIAFMPQASEVAFPFSVGEVVRMGLYAAGRGAGARVNEALQAVGLADRAAEPFGTLSAGQRQRVTLARALAQLDLAGDRQATGKVLIVDEPVSAMDPARTLTTLDTLRGLARRGATVIVVLHDLSLVLRAADDAAMISAEGRLTSHGPVSNTLRPDALRDLFGVAFEPLSARGRVVTMLAVPDGDAAKPAQQ